MLLASGTIEVRRFAATDKCFAIVDLERVFFVLRTTAGPLECVFS